MEKLELQNSILNVIKQLSYTQQVKLLEFVQTLVKKNESEKKHDILKFAGAFEEQDLKEFKKAIKDCEQIDKNEW